MPRPPRLCARGRVVPHGVLCECQREATRARNQRYDASRPTARQRGYDSAWRKARSAFLKRFPWCAWAGCTAPATCVDHVIPHRGDKRLFWHRANWQPLCEPCHNSVKQRQERAL